MPPFAWPVLVSVEWGHPCALPWDTAGIRARWARQGHARAGSEPVSNWKFWYFVTRIFLHFYFFKYCIKTLFILIAEIFVAFLNLHPRSLASPSCSFCSGDKKLAWGRVYMLFFLSTSPHLSTSPTHLHPWPQPLLVAWRGTYRGRVVLLSIASKGQRLPQSPPPQHLGSGPPLFSPFRVSGALASIIYSTFTDAHLCQNLPSRHSQLGGKTVWKQTYRASVVRPGTEDKQELGSRGQEALYQGWCLNWGLVRRGPCLGKCWRAPETDSKQF